MLPSWGKHLEVMSQYCNFVHFLILVINQMEQNSFNLNAIKIGEMNKKREEKL